MKALEDTPQTDPAQLELRLEKIEECAEKYEEMASATAAHAARRAPGSQGTLYWQIESIPSD